MASSSQPSIWVEVLVSQFLEMFIAADNGDSGIFEAWHDQITKNYKELEFADQGAFHQRISDIMKDC